MKDRRDNEKRTAWNNRIVHRAVQRIINNTVYLIKTMCPICGHAKIESVMGRHLTTTQKRKQKREKICRDCKN